MYLAIDTSSEFTGLAVIDKGEILAELTWHCASNHTVELLPHLDSLLKQSALNLKDMLGVIVARGPGSFNGLRVGLGTAKGLAFSLGVPLAGISTLEAAAYQHAEARLPVCAIFNAGKNEIACGIYQLKNGEWKCLRDDGLSTIAELATHVGEKTIFCGEPTEAMQAELRAALGEKAVIPEAEALLRRPGFLARLGEKRLDAGLYDDAATLQPIYLRQPHISPPKSRSAGAAPLPAQEVKMAVIWDMDGTIVNTASQHFKAWQAVFQSRGVAFSREDFKRGFGLRNDTIIKDIMGAQTNPDDIAAISKEKTELFRESVLREGVGPMPGAIELLKALHEKNVPMAVASSAPKQNIETFTRLLGIESLFAAVASGEEVTKGKPDPEIFLLAASKLGMEARSCVVIEDAVGGIQAARAAGMRAIGVAANHPRRSLDLAHIVVDSLAELTAGDIEKLIQKCDTNALILNGGKEMEQTLVLVKPDAVERGFSGAIIGRLESAGLKLVALKMLQMDNALAERHYAPHKEKPFFKGLISFITSGPIVAAVFEGDDAVASARRIMGATDPAKSEPGSIRRDFGIDIERNAVHGSDSVKTAEHEIKLYFKDSEILSYTRKQ